MAGRAPKSVRLQRVSVRYGHLLALKELSLEVRPGELLGLLGPSGCGKTTLLRSVAGFVPHDGRIFIGERDVTRLPSHRRNIGMVFQDYALFPHMTAGQNVAFGLRMRRMPRAETDRRVDEVLALVSMQGARDRLPRQLSGGQQQRVALARALVIEPSVLLLDEPLSALDRKLREEMQVELRLLQKRVGITTLFVTHDQEEALALSDRIAVLQDGEALQVGSPEEIYEAPCDRFVSGFVGKANRLSATVVGRDGEGLRCRLGDGTVVTAGVAGGAATGERVELTVRPEKIVLVGPEGAAPANRVKGIVRHRIYYGMFTEFHVEIGSGERLVVLRQNVRGPGAGEALPPGTPVVAAWSSDACSILPVPPGRESAAPARG